MDRGARVVGRADRMSLVTTGASRNFLILRFTQALAMYRGIIFQNLIYTQARIVLPHERRVGMTLAAYLDDLSRCRFTDVAFLPIPALQAHNTWVAAMTGGAAKTFGGMNIRVVGLGRLGQLFYPECQMTSSAAILRAFCFRRKRYRMRPQHKSRGQCQSAAEIRRPL